MDNVTIGEFKQMVALFRGADSFNPYGIGETWFFRTVTHHLSGEVKAVGPQEIVLKGGTVLWIADDGRFADLFVKGNPNEKEPYGKEDVVIGRGAIVDATRLTVHIEVVQK